MANVPSKIAQELKQNKPFAALEVEAFLNLVRTADQLGRGVAALLKAHDLTPTQYNVLRILRGAEPDGLPCGEIGARLVTFDPDTTRLLDRLEKRRLTSRSRDSADRRVVVVRITREGLDLLAKSALDEGIVEHHRRQFHRLTRAQVTQLIELLELLRTPST
jgi:DNA-binding MarR family transcriptional regulator